MRHRAAQSEDSNLKHMRGVKLANHITRILELCSARMDSSKEVISEKGIESKDEVMPVDHEECEPKAVCPQSLELQDSENSQNRLNPSPQQSVLPGTPLDPAHYCVVSERVSNKSPVGQKCGDVVRQKPQFGLESDTPEKQADCGKEASGVSREKIHVRPPCNEDTKRETHVPYSCVSERLKWPEKDSTERQTDEIKKEEHSVESTLDASHEQQGRSQRERAPSEVTEFLITDSMKGVRNSLWVYQYFGVVDAKTGNPWAGSVEEYCR